MKSTGIIRRLDDLGRIVLPSELRKLLNLKVSDSVEIYVSGESIILKKYLPACIFCDSADNVITFKGKNICKKCLKQMGEKIN